MKKTVFTFLFLLSFSFLSIAQQKAELLTYPKDWRLEQIKFPLDFAEDINWKGYEELRFSPGMFKKNSDTYFTYYFALNIEDKTNITKKELSNFLIKYYKGLCKAVNSNDKFNIDYSKISVDITQNKPLNFDAEIIFFDSFTDGKKVTLSIKIKCITTNKNTIKLYATVTPKKNSNKLEKLHQLNIKNNFLH